MGGVWMLQFLLYFVDIVGVLSVIWYLWLISKFVKSDLAKLKMIKLVGDASFYETDRHDPIGFKTIFNSLSPDKQVFAGICVADLVSVLFLNVSLYTIQPLVIPFILCLGLFASYGIFCVIRGYSEYEDVTVTENRSLNSFVEFLPAKIRFIFGATICSVVILIILCLI